MADKKLSTKQTPETPVKITLEELLNRSDKIKSNKKQTKEIFVESLNGTITIQKPERSVYLEAFEMEDLGDIYLIYNSVIEPNLKSSELHKTYGVKEPYFIVEAIFETGEILSLAAEILNLGGYKNKVTAVEEIKN